MATLNVDLPETLDRFVEDRVRSGSYQDVGAVVRAGLGLLKARTDRERAKAERFERLVREGLADLEAGRFEDVEDVSSWLDGLGRAQRP